MSRAAAFAGLLVVAIAAGPAATPVGARKQYLNPTSAEDFQKILAGLTAEAEEYAKLTNDGGPPGSKALANAQYSAKSVEHLRKALATRLKDPQAELYVAYQLLQPMYLAGNDLLRKFRPLMTKLLARCRYQPMPAWPKRMLSDLNVPARISKHARKLRMQRRDQALARKKAREQAIVKRNRLANALEKTLKELLIIMADEKADDAALDRLEQEVDQEWTTFQVTLAAVKRQAVRMKPDQAKKYYHRFIRVARKVRNKKRYADPTRPNYSNTGNSSFHRQERHFALDALKIVNLLATSAKEPAVILPGGKKRPVKRRPRRR